VIITSEQYDRLHELAESALYSQAWDFVKTLGPITTWEGTKEKILAGRLAHQWGAERLAWAMLIRAYRADGRNALAAYSFAYVLWILRGPWEALRFFRRTPELPEADARLQAEYLALQGMVAASFRDFDSAEDFLKKALALAGDHPWLFISQLYVFQQEDRYEDALESARHARKLKPWYRAGLESEAHLLTLLGRSAEAVELLREANRHVDCGAVWEQLSGLLVEESRYPEALEALEQAVLRYPLPEKATQQRLAARRSDLHYHLGDYAKAIEFAQQAGEGFFQRLAENLQAAAPDAKRVLLPVEFVRQHYMTCTPATLTAVSNYWSLPADHLEVAEAICYDGTPTPSERRWTEEQGFLAREFTLTWDSARALLDRGVPLVATTTEPTSGHSQAVIGYDGRRGILLIRDPTHPQTGEALAEDFLKCYRPVGPRAMAFLPRDGGQRLEGLDLPDASLFDSYYQFQRSLLEHCRDRAVELLRGMEHAAPEHRLTYEARYSLAQYDVNAAGSLQAVDGLLRLYPESQVWLFRKICLQQQMNRRNEVLSLLEEQSRKPGVNPSFCVEYAQMLRSDGRRCEEALKWSRKAVRRMRTAARPYHILGHVLWTLRRWEEALDAYRAAFCLDDKDEQHAESFFLASRSCQKSSKALAMLVRRWKRFGAKSSGPVRTLFWALDSLGRTAKGFPLLHKAMQLRPHDGDLMIYAARVFAAWGRQEEAQQFVERARGIGKESYLLRAEADIALFSGDPAKSLAIWKRIVELEPLAMDAQRQVVARISEVEGREASLEYLQRLLEKFPHHHELHVLRSEGMRDEDPACSVKVLRQLLEGHPEDAWARRELAFQLAKSGSLPEALAEAEKARRLDPHNSFSYSVRGMIEAELGRTAEARESYRQALWLDADNVYAGNQLLGLSDAREARLDSLRFLQGELKRQVLFGDGIQNFRGLAHRHLEPAELLKILEQALAARPDLWQCHSAMVHQLLEMNRLDRAFEKIEEACRRFPLIPPLWLDRAEVCRHQLDENRERESLQQACAMAPRWAQPLRALSDFHERRGDYQRVLETSQRLVALDPGDGVNLGYLAHAYWNCGQKGQAVETLTRALRLYPGYEWGWNSMREWTAELKQPSATDDLVREIARQRPNRLQSWLLLADILQGPETLDERFQAIERALQIAPRSLDAHDRKAILLVEAGRFSEALEACRPAILGDPPVNLQGREAWIIAQRGDLQEASARMRRTLETDNSYMWGWWQLCEWSQALQDYGAMLNAASQMTRLSPNDSFAHWNLAQAHLARKDRAGAKKILQHLLEIAPNYLPSTRLLFELQIEDCDREQAELTWKCLEPHLDPEERLVRRAQLADAGNDTATALKAFRQLAITPRLDDWHLKTSTRIVDKFLGEDGTIDVMLQELQHPNLNPQWVDELVRHLLQARRWRDTLTLFSEIDDRSDRWRAAAHAFLDAAGTNPQAPLEKFLRVYSGRLRADDSLWGMAGFALRSRGLYRRCTQWLADWRRRPDAGGWALENLAHSLYFLKKSRQAADVNRQALARRPDHSRALHELWLAHYEFFAGNLPAAREHWDRVQSREFHQIHKVVHDLCDALWKLKSARAERKQSREAEAYRAARSAVLRYQSWARSNRLVRRLCRRAIWRFVREPRSLWIRLCAFGRWLGM
jgi:cellulose synthase operon protein C